MIFDRIALSFALEARKALVRVVIAKVAGSVPRGTGTSMLVWEDGQDGSIGGGALEYEAAQKARRMLREGTELAVDVEPLGPALGQCCGGTVTLVYERWDGPKYRNWLDEGTPFAGLIARPIAPEAGPLPEKLVSRLTREAEGSIFTPLIFEKGWLIESLWSDRMPVWIHGAGHVGRALAETLAPLPDFHVHLIDDEDARLPEDAHPQIVQMLSPRPGELVAHAPLEAHHLVMTYSHAHDFEICHRLLQRGFASAGLIGSKTKWARFKPRLRDLGHEPAQIDRIACPIGAPELGKHPQAIAIGVAAQLLNLRRQERGAGDDDA